ncbi:hypothetical protein HMPREF1301_00108 [Propionibacterium sp. KPL2005]|nr:hypothetical protein HMPREF1301_00108 [Propionibacterium sp. KPL2005]ERS26624.1 hypothetical protein HMPREF1297_02213 [Propionibacterium sp. KPL2000]
MIKSPCSVGKEAGLALLRILLDGWLMNVQKSRIVVLLISAVSILGLFFALPGFADTARATPMTTWKNLSVKGGSATASGKTRGYKRAVMSSDGVWHSKAQCIFSVSGHKKSDRGGYGKVDASVLYYKCQPMPGANCIPKVLRTSASGTTGRLVSGKSKVYTAGAKIHVGRNERGGWRRSSKLCVDLVLRHDSCSSELNW